MIIFSLNILGPRFKRCKAKALISARVEDQKDFYFSKIAYQAHHRMSNLFMEPFNTTYNFMNL